MGESTDSKRSALDAKALRVTLIFNAEGGNEGAIGICRLPKFPHITLVEDVQSHVTFSYRFHHMLNRKVLVSQYLFKEFH
jgi:hypothetical protein